MIVNEMEMGVAKLAMGVTTLKMNVTEFEMGDKVGDGWGKVEIGES
jgi:hypothetical protein